MIMTPCLTAAQPGHPRTTGLTHMNGMPIPSDRSPTNRPIRGRTQHCLAKPILCWLLSPFSSQVLLYPHSHCPTRKSSFCCFLFPLNRRQRVLSPQSTHKRMQLLCAQSCPSLCSTMDYSLPGSWAHGISQARTHGWVAISYSRGSSWPRDWTRVSCSSFLPWRIPWTEEPGDLCSPWVCKESTQLNN